jgi:putative membrane protein
VSGYFIAWASEYSSIHNGFPYGEYHYIYENLRGELFFAGVPFFDSLSYPFMIFAGWKLACLMIVDKSSKFAPAKAVLLGALLTMLLDVVIDPVTKLGSRWFLGEIYYYAHEGMYFGVPLTNFAGWFLVPLAVISFNLFAWKTFPALGNKFFASKTDDYGKVNVFLYAGFYFGIMLFQLSITIYLQQWKIAAASSAIITVLFLALCRSLSKRQAATSK